MLVACVLAWAGIFGGSIALLRLIVDVVKSMVFVVIMSSTLLDSD